MHQWVNADDFAGLMSTTPGRLFSTHVGDDLQYLGFQEGANVPNDPVVSRSKHPIFSPSVQLVGALVLVCAVLYMDKRIKVNL